MAINTTPNSHLAHSTPSHADHPVGGGIEGDSAQATVAAAPRNTDRTIALILFAIAFALYLRGGARDVLPGDAGEFQFAAWTFGVAHATGYPLYLIVGGIWQHLLGFLGVNPAHALNMLSALFGAASVSLFYVVVMRWVPGVPVIRRTAAVVAAAYLLTNPTFWSQALIAEVYTLHALFVVLMLYTFQSITRAAPGTASPLWLALVVGLSLAHHATTVLFLPALAIALWMVRDRLTRSGSAWLFSMLLLLAPLLLYLYIPLRATPAASPWYFPQLGSETLALFQPGLRGMLDFVTGRSISVGFGDLAYASGEIGNAFTLWRIHIGWAGFALALFGIYSMWRTGKRALLVLTLFATLTLQIFNLFYAIEDILVYYIPIYIFAYLWLGFGAAQIGDGIASIFRDAESNAKKSAPAATPANSPATEANPVNWEMLGVLVIAVLLLLPLQQASAYMSALDQFGARQARQMWETVLAGNPDPNAILISNDRNEIVPLYYLQRVENRRTDLTGIFPLIAPETRFVDIGATTATALASGAPVYLVKSMPGLNARFDLQPAGESLVRVAGDAAANPQPQFTVNQQFGPLTLLGIDIVSDVNAPAGEPLVTQNSLNITPNGENPAIRLYWRVDGSVPGAYTTTVQAFDAASNRIAQSDIAAGGVYYPTSLWKSGETLVEEHPLQPTDASRPGTQATSLLIGMYTGPELTQLAPAILIDLANMP